MNFLQHTLDWYNGEAFEASLIGIFGVIVLIVALLFWKLGFTPNAKYLVIPLVVFGLLLSIMGTIGFISNKNKLTELKRTEIINEIEFIQSEAERVEGFQWLYTFTIILAAVSFFLAVCFFIFSNSKQLQAIGIVIILLGLTGLVIDYFSKERADFYYNKILEKTNSYGNRNN